MSTPALFQCYVDTVQLEGLIYLCNEKQLTSRCSHVLVLLCNRTARSYIGSFVDPTIKGEYTSSGLNTIVRRRALGERIEVTVDAAISATTGLTLRDFHPRTQVAVYCEDLYKGAYFVIGMEDADWARHFSLTRIDNARWSRIAPETFLYLSFNYEKIGKNEANSSVIRVEDVREVGTGVAHAEFALALRGNTRIHQDRLVYELIRRTVAFGFLKVD